MGVREKLVELLNEAEEWANHKCDEFDCETCPAGKMESDCFQRLVVGRLIDNGVTVQKHGYWETAVEVKYNTVCGNGVKIEYKRCSCCKNPAKFFEDDFCGNCGAKLDLPQPPKGE